MKYNIKSLIAFLAAAISLAACQQKLLPQQDIYGKYKGETGTFAYIVGGKEALYSAETCNIAHTPIGEMGEVSKDITIALTAAQKSSVTVTLAEDNSNLTGGYEAFPTGVLKYAKTLTIPAGETEVSTTVNVNNADFAKFDATKYMSVLRIASVSGADVQPSTNSATSLIYVNVQTIDPANDRISLKTGESTYSIVHYTNETISKQACSVKLEVTGTEPTFLDTNVEFEVDNTLIAAYNEAHGTSYVAIPSDVAVNIPAAVLAKDATSASTTLTIPEVSNTDRSTVKLTTEPGYVVPVKIKSCGSCTCVEGLVYYIVINVKVNDFSSEYFMSLDLTKGINGNMYANAMWNTPVVSVSDGKFMLSINFYVDHFKNSGTTISRLCEWCDTSEGHSIMLRWGEGGKGNRLQVCGAMTGNFFLNYEFEEKVWYTLTLAGTGTQLVLYANGQQIGSAPLQRKDFIFQRFELGMSWGGYFQSQAFNGRITNMVACKGDMTSNYYWNSYKKCFQNDIATLKKYQSYFGITVNAYWPFNEGKGHIFNDTIGGFNMDWSDVWATPDESNYIHVDYSAAIEESWASDKNNIYPEW